MLQSFKVNETRIWALGSEQKGFTSKTLQSPQRCKTFAKNCMCEDNQSHNMQYIRFLLRYITFDL